MSDLHRALDATERRVLGCLVEKELSTPDAYPLSGNSLLAACNQTTNRDPVMSLQAEEVEEALKRLMGDLLVWRERGARVLRWKHLVDEKLRLDVPGKAVVAELLLRGPQTPGELRGRTVRMHAFGGLGEVEGVLTELRARGLVEELPRAPGQKERRWRHLLGEERVASAGTRGVDAEPPERHLHAPAAGASSRPGVGAAAQPPWAPRPEAAAPPRPASGVPGSPDTGGSPVGNAPRTAVAAGATPGDAAASAAQPRPGAAAPAPAGTSPSQLALERRVTQLEERLAEVLARLARLEEGGGR